MDLRKVCDILRVFKIHIKLFIGYFLSVYIFYIFVCVYHFIIKLGILTALGK